MPVSSIRSRRSSVVAVVAVVLCAFPALPALAASSPGEVRFAVEGVGNGTFADARLAPNPGSSEEQPDPLCLTLEGGSPDNPAALNAWMKSSISEEAIESANSKMPDATLTVLADRDGLKKGVYRLSDVSVRHFRADEQRGSTVPRVEGVEINCGAVDDSA